jgi:hypothetical protein
MLQPPWLALLKIRAFVDLLLERRRRIDSLAHSPTPTDQQNHYSILKPCRMSVVYQAADQPRFIVS